MTKASADNPASAERSEEDSYPGAVSRITVRLPVRAGSPLGVRLLPHYLGNRDTDPILERAIQLKKGG
jgi:hypothetical protein